MTTLLYLIWICVALLATMYLFLQLVKAMAEKDWVFTKVPEPGRFKFLMKTGRLVKTLENVVGWSLNGEGLFVRGDREQTVSERLFGAFWMGISPLMHIKVFENWSWTEFRMLEDANGKPTAEYGISSRKKDITDFLFQFTISVPVKDMELVGNIQVSVNVPVTVYALDPEKAFFVNKNWVDFMVGRVQAGVRGWVTQRTFEELKELTESSTRESEFTKVLRQVNGIDFVTNSKEEEEPVYTGIVPGGLFEVAGVVVWTGYLQDLEVLPGDAANALRQREINILKGNADVAAEEKRAEQALIKARADASVIEAKVQAEVDRITRLGTELGTHPEMTQLMIAEAIARLTNLQAIGTGFMPTIDVSRRP